MCYGAKNSNKRINIKFRARSSLRSIATNLLTFLLGCLLAAALSHWFPWANKDYTSLSLHLVLSLAIFIPFLLLFLLFIHLFIFLLLFREPFLSISRRSTTHSTVYFTCSNSQYRVEPLALAPFLGLSLASRPSPGYSILTDQEDWERETIKSRQVDGYPLCRRVSGSLSVFLWLRCSYLPRSLSPKPPGVSSAVVYGFNVVVSLNFFLFASQKVPVRPKSV